MLRTILTPTSVLVALVVTLAVLDGGVRAFNVAEATIAQIEAELSSGRLTCQQVIQLHLNRIAAYDKAGPRLNAVIALNQQAIAQAQALDKSGGPQGRRLFCIPVAIKDNIDQLGYPTAAGSVALNSTFPSSSALLLQKLLDAGAIVVARVNMAELAMDGMNTNSSLGGQTLNSYNRLVTPTGSSGGTGTAIAASFAVIGIGSDTNGSIQNPSSVQSLVGLRSTQGLISSIGVFPMLDWQDVAGPMTRTVEDLARAMDVIDAGSTWLRPAVPYSSMLDQKALRGVRIGFLQSTIVASHSSTTNRTTVPSQEVVANCKRTMDEFAQLGASVTLVHPNVSFFKPYMMYNSIDPQALRCAFAEERSSWDYYFATRTTPSSPIKSTAQMVAAMQRNPAEIPSIVRKVSQINMLGKPNCTGIPALGCIKFQYVCDRRCRPLHDVPAATHTLTLALTLTHSFMRLQ